MTNDIAVRVHKDSVVQDSIYGKRVRGLDVFLTVIIYTCAGFSILLLAGIMGYVFVRGIPHVTWAFLSTASSATKGNLWNPGKYHKHTVHCNYYPAHRHAPGHWLCRISE